MQPRAKRAEFVTSAAAPSGFPAATLPEIAFAGRSNVGKSSLINGLCGVSGLARASNTPGRTRLLNWFHVVPPAGPPVHFVDLPGYGYAKVSKSMREAWRPLIEAYLGNRETLRGMVLLIDARRGAETEEAELMEWLAAADIPAVVVLTKSDKLAKNKRKPAAFAVKKALSLQRDPVIYSALTGDGADALWRHIRRLAKPR